MTAPHPSGGEQSAAAAALDLAVARLLRAGILAAIALLAIGVVLMATSGRSPLDRPFPSFDVARIASDIAALRPEGFLWLGLAAVILTPITRVTASLVGYLRAGDRSMALISIAILGVIATSIVISIVVQ